MNHTRRNAAVVAVLAVAGLVAVGATGLPAWAMGGWNHMGDGAEEARLFAEIEAIESEREAVLEGIGVSVPSLTEEEASRLLERAEPIFAGYVAASNGDADAEDVDVLNARYDALLAEFDAAPPQLSEAQISAIAEHMDTEQERMSQVYGDSNAGMSAEDAAELKKIGAEAEDIARSFGIDDQAPTVVQEFTLGARLAPLEHRYDAIYAQIDALYDKLDELDRQNEAIMDAAGLGMPELTDEQRDDFEEQMQPLEKRAEEIYYRAYSAHVP